MAPTDNIPFNGPQEWENINTEPCVTGNPIRAYTNPGRSVLLEESIHRIRFASRSDPPSLVPGAEEEHLVHTDALPVN